MRQFGRLAIASLVGFTMLGSALHAQRSDCTYDTCALRVQGRWVVRGLPSEPVGYLPIYYGDRVQSFFVGSDSAMRYARRYTAARKRVFWSRLMFGAAAGVATGWFRDDRDPKSVGYAAAGVGLASLVYSARQDHRAWSELGRAIWWYNRDLPR